MNAKRIGMLLCLLALTAAACAEPSREKGDRDGGARERGDRERGGRERWDRDKFRAQMEKDWEAALAHFREHSPRRAEAFGKMSEEQQEFFKPLIIGRHRGIKWLSRDPDLRKLKEQQIRIEDDIFGYKQGLATVEPDSAEAGKLMEELRRSVAALVDARMLERSLRIERLEMLVAEEREMLKDDQLKRQSLIEKRLEDILAAEVPVVDPPKMPLPPQGDRRRGGEKAGDGEGREEP